MCNVVFIPKLVKVALQWAENSTGQIMIIMKNMDIATYSNIHMRFMMQALSTVLVVKNQYIFA